jgi:hypothetical protein
MRLLQFSRDHRRAPVLRSGRFVIVGIDLRGIYSASTGRKMKFGRPYSMVEFQAAQHILRAFDVRVNFFNVPCHLLDLLLLLGKIRRSC